MQFNELRRNWLDNNKMDLQEVEKVGMDWIDLVQYRDRLLALVSAVMNIRVTYNVVNLLSR